MSEQNKEEITEETFSFEKSMNILKDVSKSIAKEQKKFEKPLVVTKKTTPEDIENHDLRQLLSLEKQYSIILGSAMRFVNPVLKNWEITPLNNKEIDDLARAILNISEGNVKKTVQKIEKRFESLAKLSKFIELIAVFWEIGLPRYSELKGSIVKIKAKQQGAVKQ